VAILWRAAVAAKKKTGALRTVRRVDSTEVVPEGERFVVRLSLTSASPWRWLRNWNY